MHDAQLVTVLGTQAIYNGSYLLLLLTDGEHPVHLQSDVINRNHTNLKFRTVIIVLTYEILAFLDKNKGNSCLPNV